MTTTPPTNQKPKPKPKNSAQEASSWLDLLTPHKDVLRYGAQSSPEHVVQTIKALHNSGSRNVTIAKRPTPQGLVYKFRVEFREKEDPLDYRGRRTRGRKEWEIKKQIDGTIKAGAEGEYPSIIEFTPESITLHLQAVAGFFVMILIVLAANLPPAARNPILIMLVIFAALAFVVPYLYVTFGKHKTMLEQRMEDVMQKLQAEKIEDAGDSAPKPKRRAAPKPKTDA